MNPNSYAVGTQVTLTGTFTTQAGNLVNPTTVTAEVCFPDRQIIDVSNSSSQSQPRRVHRKLHPNRGRRPQLQNAGHRQLPGRCIQRIYRGRVIPVMNIQNIRLIPNRVNLMASLLFKQQNLDHAAHKAATSPAQHQKAAD